MKIHHYTVVFQKEPEGGYTVVVPALPGCVSYGDTIEKSTTAIQEAIDSYLGSLAKDKQSPPSDVSFVATVDVNHSTSSAVYA